MQVMEIITIASTLLGKENVIKELNFNSPVGDSNEVLDKLFRLINIVVTELSSAGFYLIYKENVTVQKGNFSTASLRYAPVEILSVEDQYGQTVDFTLKGENLICKDGNMTVNYAYYPAVLDRNDQLVFENEQITTQTIALGVCAEYCLTLCDFEGACVWHDKYAEQLKKIAKVKNFYLKGRAWA